MNILIVIIPITLALGFGFLMAFIRFASKGEFDDVETPALRILADDVPVKEKDL